MRDKNAFESACGAVKLQEIRVIPEEIADKQIRRCARARKKADRQQPKRHPVHGVLTHFPHTPHASLRTYQVERSPKLRGLSSARLILSIAKHTGSKPAVRCVTAGFGVNPVAKEA